MINYYTNKDYVHCTCTLIYYTTVKISVQMLISHFTQDYNECNNMNMYMYVHEHVHVHTV